MRHWQRAALAAAVAVIAVATLVPASGNPEPLLACLFCGDEALADFINNIVLFAPLGLFAVLSGTPLRRAIIAGGALSAGVELAQFLVVPGRDPSIGDIAANTIGAGVGALLAHQLPRLRGLGLAARRRLAAGALVLTLAVIGLTLWLYQPSLPVTASWYGQWTPALGNYEWYRGRVLSAALGELPLPPYRLLSTLEARNRLLGGDTLRVTAIAGPEVNGLAPLFSIYDERRQQILLLGPDRHDFVGRVRLRSRDLMLDQPEMRLRGALRGVNPGDTITVTFHRDGRGWCLAVAAAAECSAGFPPTRAWAMMMFPGRLPRWLGGALDAAVASVLLAGLALYPWMLSRRA